MILLHGDGTLPKIAAGGKAYASRSSHGRLSASTARGSGTGNTNRGNLLLNLVANRSIGAGATCCISFGKPLEGETTLFEWFGLVWIAGLPPRSAGPGCVGL